MKVSIISTIYNKELFLEEHIKSLLNQDYKNIEFIFVNDGSTDSSLEILNKYQDNNNLKIISQKNMGPNLARKTGFKNSSGDYIYFVDSDDFLYNSHVISQIVRNIKQNNNCDCLLYKMMNRYNRKDVIDNCLYQPKIKAGLYKIEKIYNGVFRNSLCYKIFKRDKIKLAYFIDERNYEDGYLSYKILSNCHHFYYSEKPIYIVNRQQENSGSLTKKYNLDSSGQKYKIIKRLISECPSFLLSLKKLYLKAYLDDLNNSLLLSDENALAFLKDLKNYQIKDCSRLKYIFSFHYLNVFIFSSLYKNYKMNRTLKAIRLFLIKLKKKIRG